MNRREEVVSDVFPALTGLREDSSSRQRRSFCFWVAEALDRSEASDTPLRPWPAYRNRVNTRILPDSGQNLRDLAVLTGQLSGSSIFDSPPTKLDRARLRP